MRAREVMTVAVVSVAPDTTTLETARILRNHGISAVPVVDDAGKPIGMLSEGDLIGRDDNDRKARRDWWLTLLAQGEELNPEFLASLRTPVTHARDVMTSPVITVGEDEDIRGIARLLIEHHIKRVPVLRDGRIVGIVSRADLVRALAAD
jgi:CBS domain-containing protein